MAWRCPGLGLALRARCRQLYGTVPCTVLVPWRGFQAMVGSSRSWEQRSWAEQPTTPRCMQMGRESQELQQGCAVYPPGLPCQRRGDKNRFNLQNHPLDTKSKQLVRSRVRDVKGAGRDPLCLSASSTRLCHCSQRSVMPLLAELET